MMNQQETNNSNNKEKTNKNNNKEKTNSIEQNQSNVPS